jgi:1-deoxy-D-xylulose-5-phosphate synthase
MSPPSLLEAIQNPADLRRLPRRELAGVASELRALHLATVARHGGHLAAGLGAVELTIALHYAFDTPHDRLVWDIGHQCYPHKILTGRRERITSIRQQGGLAPFLSRAESEYDSFGAGHSSTAISAALGMALAARAKGERRRCVAVIGDGGLTAGMAYEALAHAGGSKTDLLVVLNDNQMSIAPSAGALHNHLTRLLSSRAAQGLRAGGKQILGHLPPLLDLARVAERQLKNLVTPETLFEALGLHYFGPVDGHDLDTLINTLDNLRDLPGPRLLHVVTRKGEGYAPARANPVAYHGVGRFDPEAGLTSPVSGAAGYARVFGDWCCDMAAHDTRLAVITPAMGEGSGLAEFAQRFPERYLDVAIAEQHAVTLAAGLACEGMKPVVAIYSTFLQRAYDQLIHDVALQNLPVLFAIDRAGIVGPDGPTHCGSFDLAYLRCVPNLIIMAPADERECRQMLSTGFAWDGPVAVRYPRGAGTGAPAGDGFDSLPVGRAELRRKGRSIEGIAILAFGATVAAAEAAAERLDATLVNMRYVKPLDEALLRSVAAEHTFLVTVEDGAIAGGAGSAVAEFLATAGHSRPLLQLGLPDRFLEHGTREAILTDCGLDAAGIEAAIRARLRQDARSTSA